MPIEPAHATHVEVQGVLVPKLGLGTSELTGAGCREGVRDALELGYCHIDTARAYGNEAEVGAGLAASGVDRGEVFLVTKLWFTGLRAADVREQLEASLHALGVDYVDLLLIHWPNDDVLVGETLAEMSEMQRREWVRHLGVSNFTTAQVDEALTHAPLLANQVEYHPYLGQPALLAQARERDLALTAYSPLAHGRLLDDPVLAEVGEAHGKTAAQVALRWLFDQSGVAAVPKAASHANRAANLEVFDFTLSDEERATIGALERGERTVDPSFAPRWD